MGVLSNSELKEGMNKMARQSAVVTWQKSHITSALQAVENWFENNKTGAISAIGSAAPGKFTPAQKKKIVDIWLVRKAKKVQL